MKKHLISSLVLALLVFVASPAWAAGGNYSPDQLNNLFLRFLNFAVFIGILFYLLRKPVSKFFRDRREGIARNLEYLETQARNLEEQTEILNKQISDIASERDSILAQYERMGQKEADRIISEAQSMAQLIIDKANAAMELEMKAARQLLMKEVVTLSTQAATDLIKSSINQDDQKRLAAEFMAQVEKLKSATN